MIQVGFQSGTVVIDKDKHVVRGRQSVVWYIASSDDDVVKVRLVFERRHRFFDGTPPWEWEADLVYSGNTATKVCVGRAPGHKHPKPVGCKYTVYGYRKNGAPIEEDPMIIVTEEP